VRPRGVKELLAEISRAMARLGADWYVFGAQAVGIWAQPRTTKDIDVTVRSDGDPHRIVSELDRAGFRLRVSDVDGFVERTSVLPFAHESGLNLDVVLAGSGLEDEFLARSRSFRIHGEVVRLIDPSDLVVTKVLAGRPKDQEDVRMLFRFRGAELDVERIRSLLSQLESALSQSDLLPRFEALLNESKTR
jgi:hypothetical protein